MRITLLCPDDIIMHMKLLYMTIKKLKFLKFKNISIFSWYLFLLDLWFASWIPDVTRYLTISDITSLSYDRNILITSVWQCLILNTFFKITYRWGFHQHLFSLLLLLLFLLFVVWFERYLKILSYTTLKSLSLFLFLLFLYTE